jgi:NADH-quinone oxidoreductase subunit E
MSVINEEMKSEIAGYLPRYPNKQAVTLPALHIVQDAVRCVPAEAIEEIAELLELHPSQVHDTLSFYGFFRHEKTPLGKHRLWVCRSLSCMLRGGEELLAEISKRLGIRPGETTPDGQVTLEFAECLGQCEGAPCVLWDDECHENQSLESVLALIQEAPQTGGPHG